MFRIGLHKGISSYHLHLIKSDIFILLPYGIEVFDVLSLLLASQSESTSKLH